MGSTRRPGPNWSRPWRRCRPVRSSPRAGWAGRALDEARARRSAAAEARQSASAVATGAAKGQNEAQRAVAVAAGAVEASRAARDPFAAAALEGARLRLTALRDPPRSQPAEP